MSSDPNPRPTHPPRTTLGELAARTCPGAAWRGREPESVEVTGVTLSTRRVRPGDLYAGLPGARAHGADFAVEALAAGAVAVLTDPAGADRLPEGTPTLIVDDPRGVLGR